MDMDASDTGDEIYSSDREGEWKKGAAKSDRKTISFGAQHFLIRSNMMACGVSIADCDLNHAFDQTQLHNFYENKQKLIQNKNKNCVW